MKPYKIKHKPSGLYYQPHKHRGSNISKRGKIYQTKVNGLSSSISNGSTTFRLQVEVDSVVYRLLKDILVFAECKWSWRQVVAETKIEDWEIEYIN